MKIAIDISQVVYGSGVSVYIRNLVKNLFSIDKKNEYILFGGSLRRYKELKTYASNFISATKHRERIFPIPPILADMIWNKFHFLTIEHFIGNVDVFHSSDWTQPPSKAFKITTIHDLVPIKFPKISDPKIVSVHKLRLKWVAKEVDRIIVPSQTTAYDVESIGISRDKIRVIPEAPDSIFKPHKKLEIERLKRKYRIYGKYFLTVGVSPRKNIQRIVRAFERIKPDVDVKQLVIIGGNGEEFNLKRGVIFLGQIPNEEMPIFYSGAEALVYPSLYEGFGLPILEAFVCKVPVVTSNIGSMKEVAGKAGVLVDPYSVDSIVEGIKKALKRKQILIQRGITQAKKYSWQKTAEATLKVYKESVTK